MGQLVPLLGTGVGYKSDTVSKQKRVNLYIEQNKDPDKASISMYQTPGLTFFGIGGTPTNPVVRGSVVVGNTAYIVMGQELCSQTPTGQQGNINLLTGGLGTIPTKTGRVGMASNGTQIIIVDGTGGYIYNTLTTVFTTIGAPFPNGATTVCFLNGYFIVEKAGTGQFWWSNIYDGLTWNALQFATAESNPDNLVRVDADHGILLLFGERTLEFWGPSGTTTVFQRIGAAGIEWGLAAKWSFDRFSDNSIFLAANRQGQFEVVMLQGFTATSIGDPNVIHDMNALVTANGFASLQQVTAFTYMLDKHSFYQINLPNKSYLYDGLSDSWSEVESWYGGAGGRHYADVHWAIGGQSYVSDARSTLAPSDPNFGKVGFVYNIDPLQFTDGGFDYSANGGDPIVVEWDTKHVFANLDRMTVAEFFVEFEPATVNNPPMTDSAGHGSYNPQAMLSWSKDGGRTWGNEIAQPIGMIGQYLNRCLWRMLGRSRDFVFKLRISEPLKIVITNVAMVVK